MRVQLNSILFAKTLVRKDVASSSVSSQPTSSAPPGQNPNEPTIGAQRSADPLLTPEAQILRGEDEEDEFSSKAQIMTLMTTDVDRVSEFGWHVFSLVGKSFSYEYQVISI